MPVIINGTTGLSGVSTVNLANGSVTQNILANNVAGNGPAFYAYQTSNQSFTNGAFTKVAFNAETYDTNNNYDTSLYRFTPSIPGYYVIGGGILNISSTSGVETLTSIYKNGALFAYIQDIIPVNQRGAYGSVLINMNGTTDYVEMYYYSGLTNSNLAGTAYSYFYGYLARAA